VTVPGTQPESPDDVVTIVPSGRVVFGMQLPIQSQSTLYVAPWETRAGPAELARVAQAADRAGFFYVGVCDHTAIPARLAPAMGTVWYDTAATLGWLAGITSQVRLLSHVLVLAVRHPLRAAKELATIDVLSGGRLVVGVGAGHVEEEYRTLGGDFGRRGPATDEAVVALSRALCEEFPELPGPRWPARDLGVAPRPAQRPRPPIWIGGSSRAALRRTAALGDGWLPQGTPRHALPAKIDELLALRAELRHGAPLDIGTIAEPIYLDGRDAGGDPSWKLPSFILRGEPERVAESLGELGAMGVGHVQVRLMARSADELCDQIAAFAETVVPLVSPAGPGPPGP
jgi:probable F420-dependent oxidoreductase